MKAADIRKQAASQQAKWMSQRNAELDRQAIMEELGTAESYVPSCFEQAAPQRAVPVGAMSTSKSATNSVAPEEMIDKITERVAERLRGELKQEMRREKVSAEEEKKIIENRVDDLLQTDVCANICMVCYELMQPPKQAPMLLFPCGHTFCARCLNSHMEVQKKKTCPYCRTVITSKAINHSLQQMIAAFVEKRSLLNTGTVEASSTSQDGSRGETEAHMQARTYITEYQDKAVRVKVLECEKQEACIAMETCVAKMKSAEQVLQHLEQSEADVVARMESLGKELQLVREHKAKQQTKLAQANMDKNEYETQIGLLDRTVEPLILEMDKIKLLYEHHAGVPLSQALPPSPPSGAPAKGNGVNS